MILKNLVLLVAAGTVLSGCLESEKSCYERLCDHPGWNTYLKHGVMITEATGDAECVICDGAWVGHWWSLVGILLKA